MLSKQCIILPFMLKPYWNKMIKTARSKIVKYSLHSLHMIVQFSTCPYTRMCTHGLFDGIKVQIAVNLGITVIYVHLLVSNIVAMPVMFVIKSLRA
jgi:hypothetical protein